MLSKGARIFTLVTPPTDQHGQGGNVSGGGESATVSVSEDSPQLLQALASLLRGDTAASPAHQGPAPVSAGASVAPGPGPGQPAPERERRAVLRALQAWLAHVWGALQPPSPAPTPQAMIWEAERRVAVAALARVREALMTGEGD